MKRIKSMFTRFVAFALLFAPTAAFAHVKWFVDSKAIESSEHGLVPFYYLSSKEVLVWAVIATFIVILFSIFDRIIPEPKKLVEFGMMHEKGITRTVEILIGALLLSVLFLWGYVLEPDLPINSAFTMYLGLAEMVAGILLLLGIAQRFAVGIIFTLYILMGFLVSWMPVAENIMLPAIAFYIFIKNSPKGSWAGKLDKYSVEIVRIGTAVSLIVLAFTEKLMYPELGLAFLNAHHWNFMQLIGMSWFDNRLFVLSAGFSELIFGVIYIFGYLTRINTLVMSVFFGMSVVTMLAQFHIWEMEDLCVYAAAIIFLFYGYGKTRFFHTMHPNSVWRRVHLGRLIGRK